MLWWLCGLQPNCSPKHGQPYGEGQNKIDESESLLENGAAATANNVPSSVNLHKSNYLGKMLPTFGGNIANRDELCHKGAFKFYVDKGEGGRGFPNVYAST